MSKGNSDPVSQGRMDGEADWQLPLDGGLVLRGFSRQDAGYGMGVFVHGFRSHCDGGKSRTLSGMAASQGFGWLRFDQRGCGMSSGAFRHFTISGVIDDVHRVLETVETPRCVLVGSSLGALTSIHVAVAETRRIGGLVLIAPALRFTERYIRRHLKGPEIEAWRRRGYRWFPDLYAGGCFRLDYGFCADALQYDEPPVKLACPVRVIHGSRDELLPLEDTRAWLAGLDSPSATLEIVDGGDHRLTEWSDVIARQTRILIEEINQCA